MKMNKLLTIGVAAMAAGVSRPMAGIFGGCLPSKRMIRRVGDCGYSLIINTMWGHLGD